MENMNVLILGGSYFIGKKIAKVFSENGYNVTTLNRGTKKCDIPNVDTLTCDRNDKQAMENVLRDKEFDIVIDVSGVNKMQLEIVSNALNLKTVKKFVYISSSSVYAVKKLIPPYHVGDTMGYNEYWEDYGVNKGEAELYLFKRFDNIGIDLIVLRPPYVYGEGNYAQRESFVFDHIINDKTLFIPGAGDTKIQFIYVTDLAKIVLFVVTAKLKLSQTVFNVGNREPLTFNKWISLCAQAVGKPANTYHFDYKKHGYAVRDFFPFHNYTNVLSISLLDNVYKHQETPMMVGLQNSFEWYVQNANTIEFKPQVIKVEQKIMTELNVPLLQQ